MYQNHLGKFLKLSSLKSPTIEYQLFNFSKESLKQIFLNSKCGEIINGKEFKTKPPNTDLLGTKNIYPLSCVYKKAKPKINVKKNILNWKDHKIKKKVNILSNAYMSLSLLILGEYYENIITDEKKRGELVKFYTSSVKCQLKFYMKNFRNELGIFVNKIPIFNEKGEIKEFTSSNEKINFQAQAYLMICFLKCSQMLKESSPYKIPFLNFSEEIEKMFIDFKQNIFELPSKKLSELIYAFQIYINFKPSPSTEFLNLLFLIIEKFLTKSSLSSIGTYEKIILYKSFSYLKSYTLKNNCEKHSSVYNLMSEYLWEFNNFISNSNFIKTELLNESDLISYQLYLMETNKELSKSFFAKFLLPSKVFSCFPNIPKNYESEKYFHFEHNNQNIIPDKFFKPSSYKSMDEANLTPIIYKDLIFSSKKNKFLKPKQKFHALLNMKLIFFILSNLKDEIIKAIS